MFSPLEASVDRSPGSEPVRETRSVATLRGQFKQISRSQSWTSVSNPVFVFVGFLSYSMENVPRGNFQRTSVMKIVGILKVFLRPVRYQCCRPFHREACASIAIS